MSGPKPAPLERGAAHTQRGLWVLQPPRVSGLDVMGQCPVSGSLVRPTLCRTHQVTQTLFKGRNSLNLVPKTLFPGIAAQWAP